jgi:ABC-type amino acid transport substrate-binding protein
MKKFFTLILIVLVLILGLTACGQKQEVGKTEGNNKKVVRVGTSGGYRPFTFMDTDGKLVGFEIDAINEIGKRSGFDVEFKTMGFSGLFGALDSKQIDTISNQITMTDTRKEKYLFTNPYTYDGAQIFVKEGNNSITKFEDLKGKKLGVDLGTNYETLVKDKDKNNEIQITTYKGSGGLNDVAIGRIDGYVIDRLSGLTNIQELGLKLQLAGEPIAAIENGFPLLND